MSTMSLKTSLSRASLEKLIQPTQAKKEIREIVEDAIEQAAQTILALRRKKRRETRKTEKFGENNGVENVGKEVGTKRVKETRKNDSPKNQRRENFETKSPPGKKKRKIVAKDGINAGMNVCDDSRCECGGKTIPSPNSHGVLPEEPLIFRDRYFECNGTAMYTREIYSTNGTKMKIDKEKLAKLRDLPVNSPKMLSNRASVSESDKNGKLPENLDKRPSKSPIDEYVDNKVKSIVLKDVNKSAKGMALTVKVIVFKSNGDTKQIELIVEMPDFEPTCVKYGKKMAFLE